MKNGLLIWNVLLTLLAGYLLIAHLGSGNRSTRNAGAERVKDTSTSRSDREFRLAYFEMDSIEAHYEMVKDIKAEVSRKEESMNNELERLGRDYQSKLSFYQGKQNEMTKTDIENAGMELRRLEQNINSRKSALEQEYTDFSLKSTKAIKTRIEDFIREYNKKHNYTYIIAEEPGFFYFKDTTQNITSEVLRGLNENYRATKKN
jgi:outer membrane protein